MRLIAMLFILMLFNSSAFAACVSPAGQEGDQMYNSTFNTMQFCDGTNWYSMKGGSKHPLDNLSCTDGQVASWDSATTQWVCADQSGGGGGGGSGSGAFTICTNENTDNDGTDDIAACIEAATLGNGSWVAGTADYFPLSCDLSSGIVQARTGSYFRWNGTSWSGWNSSGYANCVDGTMTIANVNAGAGGGGGLGSWETKAANTIYQAATDGFVITWGGAGRHRVLTDSNTPPTFNRQESQGNIAGAGRPHITLPIKSGDYWEVKTLEGGNPSVYWLPLSEMPHVF